MLWIDNEVHRRILTIEELHQRTGGLPGRGLTLPRDAQDVAWSAHRRLRGARLERKDPAYWR